MSATYQSHSPDAKGVTDSQQKLARLKIPEDLTGKTVLDVGCNEGWFCNVAAERGAKRVVGVDFVPQNIDFAKSHYPNPVIEFRRQPWSTLPEGPFDLVIWASAMHYELDPKSVLRNIGRQLVPDGMLILECGVAPGPSREMVMSQRHDATLWYPTEAHLQENLLEDFSFRLVSNAEHVGTDPIPRRVYHVRKRIPTVIVIRGKSGDGKSSAAQSLRRSAEQLISVDLWFYRVMSSRFHHDDVSKYIRDNIDATALTALYCGIDSAGLTEPFVRLLTKGIGASDRVVVIEGALTDLQVEAITNALDGHARVWELERHSASQYGEIDDVGPTITQEQ